VTFVNLKVKWIENQRLKISNFKDNRINLKPIEVRKARPLLEKRVQQLSEKYNFNYNKIYIKNQKTIWGSCSNKNNINLNARLLHLGQKLIDYVILHELVHTKIKNHSKDFWSTLNIYVGDSKFYDKQLRNYKIVH